MEHSPKKLLVEICDELGLTFEGQDWGIINSDPSRFAEFIDYYESREMDKRQAYQVFELVLASMNDAMLEGRDIRTEILTFRNAHGRDFPEQVEYWSKLANHEEFPIATVLR